MNKAIILSFALFCSFLSGGKATPLTERLGAVGTRMQKVIDESTGDLGDARPNSEASTREIFLHAIIVANLHCRYMGTLLVIQQNAETEGDKQGVRGVIGVWGPAFRKAVVAGRDFIKQQRDAPYSGSFHDQMKEAQAALEEMLSIIDEDISKIVEGKT